MKHKKILLTVIGLILLLSSGVGASSSAPDEAFQRLQEGNNRFTAWKAEHPRQGKKRLEETSQGQKPFAVILTCADSRVPPEVIFDQGVGDLFVVRVAGNIVTPEILGSIEYATEHLGAHLVFVLGHENCGAVDATLKGGALPGHMGMFTRPIQPALKESKCPAEDALNCSIKANVAYVVKQIANSQPILSELVHEGEVKVMGGYYSLETGKVSILP